MTARQRMRRHITIDNVMLYITAGLMIWVITSDSVAGQIVRAMPLIWWHWAKQIAAYFGASA